MKIAILESLNCSDGIMATNVEKLKSQGHEVKAYERTADVQELRKRIEDADAIVLANMKLPEDALKSAKSLKFIDVAFTGVDHIPMDLAKERGIMVANASGYANDAVAELAISLMIQLLRDLPLAGRRVRNGGTKEGLRANLLKNKIVGIVGAGAIGKTLARLLKAFGAKVVVHNRHKVDDPAIDANMGLEELLSQSDIVSLHCPLTPQTRHLIGEKELAMMKKDAFLVNTARGGVVDNEALAAALNNDVIAGAAIDVFDLEPPLPSDYPLLKARNAILTPHLGFYAVEAMDKRPEIAFDNLEKWLEGNPQNLV